jgi:hypothetical protein
VISLWVGVGDQVLGHTNVVVALKEAVITGSWGWWDVSHATIPSRQTSPSARILKFKVLGIGPPDTLRSHSSSKTASPGNNSTVRIPSAEEAAPMGRCWPGATSKTGFGFSLNVSVRLLSKAWKVRLMETISPVSSAPKSKSCVPVDVSFDGEVTFEGLVGDDVRDRVLHLNLVREFFDAVAIGAKTAKYGVHSQSQQ